ncbi:MAG: C40 family peptidase [Bacteroidota bacterium]
MKHGIAKLSVIPIRKEPTHRSELVSQLLFGEIYEVINSLDSWLHIKCCYDDYEGWIDVNQHQPSSEKDFSGISLPDYGVALELVSTASSSHHSIPLVAGSSLPCFDGLNFRIAKEKFIYNGQAVPSDAKNTAILERVAMRYQNAPYLWGGRSPFGIDCSGFTQIVYKFVGIPLYRDAYQQAEQGNLVNFIEEAIPGDLAFFNNEAGKIIHVGIILKDNRIIHSSGKVRIDKIDHFGIHNVDIKKYSHQLKVIKRIS